MAERKVLTYEGRMELRQKRSELMRSQITRRSCARLGCSNTFQKKSKNHFYCSSNCEKAGWERRKTVLGTKEAGADAE